MAKQFSLATRRDRRATFIYFLISVNLDPGYSYGAKMLLPFSTKGYENRDKVWITYFPKTGGFSSSPEIIFSRFQLFPS
jgi:hypothetical protein